MLNICCKEDIDGTLTNNLYSVFKLDTEESIYGMEKMAMSGTLVIVVLLHSLLWSKCSGLTCHCSTTDPFNPDPFLYDCASNGGTCTGDVCSVSRYRVPFEETILRCYDLTLSSSNVAICNGSSNTEDATHACCGDSDYCNADLHPLFPSEETTTQPSSSQTSPTPSDITSSPLPSDITSPPLSVTSSPSPSTTEPPTEDVMICFCDSTQDSQSQLCLEDKNEVRCTGRCYQKQFLADSTVHMEWNCLQADEPRMEMLCSGALDTAESTYRCCDEGDLCNKNLLSTTQPPTTTQATGSEVPAEGLTSKHYYIISAVVVLVGTVAVAVLLLAFVFVYWNNRRKEKFRKRTMRSRHPKEVEL